MGPNNNARDLARLAAVLDTQGADPARWPVADSAQLGDLARSDPQGRKLLAAARALDQVLGAAPTGNSSRLDALMDRVLDEFASANTGTQQPEARAVLAAPAIANALRPVRLIPMLGALAAALVIGFYAGQAGLVLPALQQVAGLAADEPDAVAPGTVAGSDAAQEGELL